MPNTGQRSKGCHACRRMKVRCDEEKPGCNRCQRVGRTCPGYREDLDNFRSMNLHSQKKVLALQSRKSNGREISLKNSMLQERSNNGITSWSGSNLNLVMPTSLALSTSSQPRLHQIPSITDWTESAVRLFFSDFILLPDDTIPITGFLEFLPEMYRSQPQGSALSMAVEAISLYNLANRSSVKPLQATARVAYGHALRKLHSALLDPTEVRSDEILTATLIITCFEVGYPLLTLYVLD